MKKKTQEKVSAKVAKVRSEEPQLSAAQAVGKAIGILRSKGVKIPKKKNSGKGGSKGRY